MVFGLIAATGGRIWVQNRTDFADARNLVTAAVALIAGAGDLTVRLGDFALGGIGTATFGAILIYHLLGSGPARSAKPIPGLRPRPRQRDDPFGNPNFR